MLRQLNLNIHYQVASLKAVIAARAQLPISAYDPRINLFIKNKFHSQVNTFYTQRHTRMHTYTGHLQILLEQQKKGLFFHNL